jgi:hypothetical protein
MARTIPTKDVDFNVVQETITTQAISHQVVWGLDVDWLTAELVPAKTRWVLVWVDYQNPATRTPLITFEKNEARKSYEPQLRLLVRNLEVNTKVTADDRRAMGIVISSGSHSPSPVLTSYPDYDTDSSTIRRVGISFRDQGSTKRAKPKGAHGAEIRWEMLETPPVNVKDLTNSSFDTRSPFTLEFEESDRGKTVYFCLRWENNVGAKGPWSEFGFAIIP